ncbi:MAG: PIN domain-containing protein [Phycisphaerae bacterium]|nr:PIN domain-containing protein [Phycisphaerae bacterium]
MPAFFDSSVVLSLLLKDENADDAARLWSLQRDRVASVLLELECLSVLRRAAAASGARLPQRWLEDREAELAAYLEEVSIREIDESVIDVIRGEDRLAGCRSLDAIQLATAMIFQSAADGPFQVCTVDRRMAEMCEPLGLAVAR